MDRKEFYGVAKGIESHYLLRRILAVVLPIFVLWVIMMLLSYIGLEVMSVVALGDAMEVNEEVQSMPIHKANTASWDVGDVVIHDWDAKDVYMLMIVVKKSPKWYWTRYLQPRMVAGYHGANDHRWANSGARVRAHYRKTWRNKGAVLHDPERFGIEIPSAPDLSHCPELRRKKLAGRA